MLLFRKPVSIIVKYFIITTTINYNLIDNKISKNDFPILSEI